MKCFIIESFVAVGWASVLQTFWQNSFHKFTNNFGTGKWARVRVNQQKMPNEIQISFAVNVGSKVLVNWVLFVLSMAQWLGCRTAACPISRATDLYIFMSLWEQLSLKFWIITWDLGAYCVPCKAPVRVCLFHSSLSAKKSQHLCMFRILYTFYFVYNTKWRSSATSLQPHSEAGVCCESVCGLSICLCGVELTRIKPVFGLSLEEHLEHTGRQISAVIEQSVEALCSPEYDALKEEVSDITDHTHTHTLSMILVSK